MLAREKNNKFADVDLTSSVCLFIYLFTTALYYLFF